MGAEDTVHSSVHRVTAAASLNNVDGDIIDVATNEILNEKNLPGPTEKMIRGMLANDSQSAVARTLFHSMLTKPKISTMSILGRSDLVIPYRFSDDKQLQLLRDYAPEFAIKTASKESHDHPMAAACRLIDRKLVYSRVPTNQTVSDVGGSIIPLVLGGMLGNPVHSCSPIIDGKDPGREVLNKLRIEEIYADPHRKQEVRESARRYLERDRDSMCDNLVQHCSYQSKVITSIHVYDIPIGDWPSIMHNKGSSLVEGCLLFPQTIFTNVSGDIPYAGARFEVDIKRNKFSMGFKNSNAWWYQHKLSDYLKYGVDQIIEHKSGTYSYKIVERRGDTVFFRILKVANSKEMRPVPVYRVPGIPMVIVNGFAVQRVKNDYSNKDLTGIFSKNARRCQHMFPAVLWREMLSHAKQNVERGTLTYERMINYYRTVAPRQSINGVIIAGGTTVEDLNQLVALIVHVSLFAYLSVAKTRVETEVLTHLEMDNRKEFGQGNFVTVMAAMGRTLKHTLSLFILPLELCIEALAERGTRRMLETGFDWSFQPEYREVSLKQLVPSIFSSISDNHIVDDSIWIDAAIANAPAAQVTDALNDEGTAAIVLDCLSDVLPEDYKTKLSEVINKAKEKPEDDDTLINPTVSEEDSGKGKVPQQGSKCGVTNVANTAASSFVSDEEKDRRRASILEAINEAQEEAKNSEAACADHYPVMMISGEPSLKLMADWREQFYNPDYWYVERGLIVNSASGLNGSDFIHSAVFVPDAFEGNRLYEVVDQQYSGPSCGEMVQRVHKRIDSDFTGWAMTDDSLMIYNGPAIIQSMKQSLAKSMDFEIVLMQGPPGCGKTTSIIQKAEPLDVILVPARKAARETSSRLKAKGSRFVKMAKERVKTVDSYMVNRLTSRKIDAIRADRLLADEAFMTREGRWLAVAALLGVSRVFAFGDEKQIPHVPRALSPSLYVKLRYQRAEESFITYRCPPQSLACWNSQFDYKVRTMSGIEGEVQMIDSHRGLEIPNGCVMMGMYQSDKKRLTEIYANSMHKIEIMTVHESQGNTYEHVWLHRFDPRKRTDNFSLYDKPEYVLVAMSRNTHTFKYISTDLDDLVSKWIKIGADSRRIEAAKDITTVGKSVEYV